MTSFSTKNRASGILAHITSLPSPHGIGDIGHSAYRFIDFLETSGQKYWQILPTTPTNLIFDSSPYMSVSAFAGSPLFISPELLLKDHYLKSSDIPKSDRMSPYLTNYQAVSGFKQHLLELACRNFLSKPSEQFHHYCSETRWLDDYALFMTLKKIHEGKPWYHWPRELATHSVSSLEQARKTYQKLYNYYCFEQYLFDTQWNALRQYAERKNVKLIGDLPIYVGLDSADVWAHQELFELSPKTYRPTRVSGVPPDYFSKTGQRWGNPLYRWNSRKKEVRDGLLDWWANRFLRAFSQVDVTRIDHFRGFESYWAIPAHEETAINGSWVRGPGISFFKKIQDRLGKLDIIAEDLGEITDRVITLRDDAGFPGMKVLQFAFDGNPDNPFLPHNFTSSNCVVYTGTHDNNTTLGWFLSGNLNDGLRQTIKAMANRKLHDDSPIQEDFIYMALSSTANLAIFPLQDLLGFGGDCRMNVPGIATGNWKWRCAPQFLTDERAKWLKNNTRRFGR